MLLVYALMLSKQEHDRVAQLQLLKAKLGEATAMRAEEISKELRTFNDSARIPLIELALPALRQLAHEQSRLVAETADALAQADRQIDFFEFAVRKMLQRHLPHLARARRDPEYFSLKPLTYDCSVLLSALAHVGHGSDAEARKAFDAGVSSFRNSQLDFKFMAAQDCTLNAIDIALNDVAAAGPQIKKQIVHACAEAVASDGLVHPREGELIRAIADAVGCPMPPLVATQTVLNLG